MTLLGRLLAPAAPRWDWVQVEVSSVCDARCVYCPQTADPERPRGRLMRLETFERLAPSLPRAARVHLQGWGEPLLNPDFIEMLRRAKAAGCVTGTTTNGMLLDDLRIQTLMENGLDLLAFSLAGVAGNDQTRPGTRLATVLDHIRAITRRKREQGSAAPDLHVAYMLLRQGLDEFSEVPELLAGSGVSEIIVSTLDCVTKPELAGQTLTPRDWDDYNRIRARLTQTADKAASLGMALRFRLAAPGRGGRCAENIERSLVVAADGLVTPCVFLNLPGADDPNSQGAGLRRRLPMGDAHVDRLEDIWQSPRYRRFRSDHARGRPPEACQGCLKLD